MSPSEIAATVRRLNPRFLVGLAQPEIDVILAAAKQRHFQAKSIVCHEGHPAIHLYLLLSGRARFFTTTSAGQKMALFWVTPGEITGGAAILSRPLDHVLSTEVGRASSMLVWERPMIRALAEKYPKLLDNGLLIAHDYFVLYRAIHLSLACKTARQRLAIVLANLATGIGHRVPAGVELDITNEELANEAHVTHFTASRLLSHWQRTGVLSKTRGKVVLPSPELLLTQEASGKSPHSSADSPNCS